jgi:sugar phosphate isomerase/epimerase
VQFGVCANPADAAWIKDAGADFIEAGVQGFLKPMDEAWAPPVDPKALPLPVAAYNGFLPADLKVTGPAVDRERLKVYTRQACRRARQMGSSVIVFGSGGARNIPDGWPREKAEEQLVEAIRIVGPPAQEAGITIVMEPLNRKECNILNTVAEGMGYLRRAKAPAVAMLCDFYHLAVENEPLENLDATRGVLGHIHIAEPVGRIAPAPGLTDYRPFFAKLKTIGYDARISLECGWKNMKTELEPALAFLRTQWQAA